MLEYTACTVCDLPFQTGLQCQIYRYSGHLILDNLLLHARYAFTAWDFLST